MRRVYFLRHAEAEGLVTNDRARRLTQHGVEQACRVGTFLRGVGLTGVFVLTSPYERALMTAELVAGKAGYGEPVVADWLGCGMEAAGCRRECRRLFESGVDGDVLLVGHEPDLSAAMSEWMGGVSRVKFKKATLAGLRVKVFEAGGGVLEFFVPCSMMNNAC